MARRTCFDCDNVDEREVKDKKVWCRSYKMYCYPEDADRCKRFEMTSSGRSSGSICYLTTACCEVMGKDDNCFELESMRDLRDNYILPTINNGEDIVRDYYDTAPDIVAAINNMKESVEIWKCLYEKAIVPCVELIKNNDYEKAYENYMKMTLDLKERYLS